MEKITIAIIDDHKIVRQGLKELLEKLTIFSVIYEFESGSEFLEKLPLNPSPDIYIIDYSMPEINGIEVLKALELRDEEYKTLLLTQHSDEQIINDAHYYGTRGYLHKNCTATELKTALLNIKNTGYTNISDALSRIKNYEPSEILIENPQLSARELEFLTLVCDPKEYTYDLMAQMMSISIKSIDNYRTSLFDRFNIKSKVGLVLFSHKYKLTKPFIEL